MLTFEMVREAKQNWPKSKLAEVEIGRSRNWPKSKLAEVDHNPMEHINTVHRKPASTLPWSGEGKRDFPEHLSG